ncbi:MAG: hypothetical protein ACUVQP_10980 [Bacteroidales bacterium]
MIVYKIIDLSKEKRKCKKYKRCQDKRVSNGNIEKCDFDGRYKVMYYDENDNEKKITYLCIKHIVFIKNGIENGYIKYEKI